MKSPQKAPQRLDLIAFGLVASGLLALAAGSAATIANGPVSGLGAAAFVGLPAAALSWFHPRVVGPVYQTWTTLGRVVNRVTRYYVLALIFGVLWLAGRAGGRIRLAPDSADQSGWMPRDAVRPAYGSQAFKSVGTGDRRTWAPMLFRWSRRTGNGWLVSLLPLLLLLAALDPRGRRSLGGSTYTLY